MALSTCTCNRCQWSCVTQCHTSCTVSEVSAFLYIIIQTIQCHVSILLCPVMICSVAIFIVVYYHDATVQTSSMALVIAFNDTRQVHTHPQITYTRCAINGYLMRKMASDQPSCSQNLTSRLRASYVWPVYSPSINNNTLNKHHPSIAYMYMGPKTLTVKCTYT